ncbi:MAG TPA: CAP domain-containing protein [Rhodocyclaceae bacterium]|nr:CAP domain-containing protein [Rhodocyclaceae bacterium]
MKSALLNHRTTRVLLIAILLLAACGGGGGGSGTTSSSGGSPGISTSSSSSSSGVSSSSSGGTPITVSPEDACGIADFGTTMLAAVNAARATGRNCGTTWYAAAPALAWNAQLAQAAAAHSHDMANNNYFSHTGLNGSTPVDRIAATGYLGSAWAENIYGGPSDIATVMTGWLASEGHCVDIMTAALKDFGAACATNASSTYRNYWTQDFASPR